MHKQLIIGISVAMLAVSVFGMLPQTSRLFGLRQKEGRFYLTEYNTTNGFVKEFTEVIELRNSTYPLVSTVCQIKQTNDRPQPWWVFAVNRPNQTTVWTMRLIANGDDVSYEGHEITTESKLFNTTRSIACDSSANLYLFVTSTPETPHYLVKTPFKPKLFSRNNFEFITAIDHTSVSVGGALDPINRYYVQAAENNLIFISLDAAVSNEYFLNKDGSPFTLVAYHTQLRSVLYLGQIRDPDLKDSIEQAHPYSGNTTTLFAQRDYHSYQDNQAAVDSWSGIVAVAGQNMKNYEQSTLDIVDPITGTSKHRFSYDTPIYNLMFMPNMPFQKS